MGDNALRSVHLPFVCLSVCLRALKSIEFVCLFVISGRLQLRQRTMVDRLLIGGCIDMNDFSATDVNETDLLITR